MKERKPQCVLPENAYAIKRSRWGEAQPRSKSDCVVECTHNPMKEFSVEWDIGLIGKQYIRDRKQLANLLVLPVALLPAPLSLSLYQLSETLVRQPVLAASYIAFVLPEGPDAAVTPALCRIASALLLLLRFAGMFAYTGLGGGRRVQRAWARRRLEQGPEQEQGEQAWGQQWRRQRRRRRIARWDLVNVSLPARKSAATASMLPSFLL